MDKKTESHANTASSTAERKRSSALVLEEFLVASNAWNKLLLKQQHKLIRADSTLNTEGKKQ
jgi:hypothetical protein